MAHNYGTQAHELAKMVQLTGKRWPLVGKRLLDDMPFIECEVRIVYIIPQCTMYILYNTKIQIQLKSTMKFDFVNSYTYGNWK